MKNCVRRNHKQIITIVVLFVWTAAVSAGSPNDAPVVEEGVFMNAIIASRDAWNVAAKDKSKAAKSLQNMDRLVLKKEQPGYHICEYVRSRLFILAEQKGQAETILLSLLDNRAVSPEALMGLIELNGVLPEKRMALESELAWILPLGNWHRCSGDDGRHEGGVMVDRDPPPPIIPKIDKARMVYIATKYGQAGLYESAWKAYIEAIYAGTPSWVNPELCPPREKAWFSPDSAPLWAQAAHHAWDAGEHRLAYEYLAKSVIFGPESQVDKAKEMLKLWKEEQGKKRPEIPKEQQREAIEEIVRLYVEMNAHPRALAVIQEHKGLLDKPNELYEKYATEWKAIVKECFDNWTKVVVLYGVKLTKDDDPTSIKIPWACTSEAVKEAKAAVEEVLKTSVKVGDSDSPTTKPGKGTN